MKNCTALALVSALALSACKSDSYMSSISLTGAESRNDLSSSVRATVEEQKRCFEEFVQAHSLLVSLQGATDEEVERRYVELRTQVDECARSMQSFGERILQVENDAMTLFLGWEVELDEFRSDIMREHSAERLKSAQSGFALLQDELTSVHGQMSTLLDSHRDYVLYFNHNLNGASVEVLERENERFEENMETLASACRLVEDDAATFVTRLDGAPNLSDRSADDAPTDGE
ncbi:MAG: DUF2959 family protein [Planctomycetota bacterium]